MYFEYCNYNKYINDYGKELSHIFKALDKGLTGLALPIHMIREVREFMPEGIVLSTPIDYPLGYASTTVRNHWVLNSLKCGVNAIDYTPNQYFVRHKWKELINEITTDLRMCSDYGATFRVFLDYHRVSNIVNYARRLADVGVEVVFPTIGYHHDDFFDNIINSKLIEKKTNLSVIFNGYIWKKSQLKILEKAKLFGGRLYNLELWCNK